jgi:hypothetical protein
MKTLYMCEICRTNYETPAAAQACEAQGFPTNIKVGDIIEKHDGYGWHNGDDAWVIHNRGMFHDVPLRNFYWLVISIKPGRSSSNRHCNEVTCVTRGVVNGVMVDGAGEEISPSYAPEGAWGVTQFNHYVDPLYSTNNPVVVTDVPPKVREEAAAFMAAGYIVGRDDRGVATVSTKKGV